MNINIQRIAGSVRIVGIFLDLDGERIVNFNEDTAVPYVHILVNGNDFFQVEEIRNDQYVQAFYDAVVEGPRGMIQAERIVNAQVFRAHVIEHFIEQDTEIANAQTFRAHIFVKELTQTAEIANTQTFRTQVIGLDNVVIPVTQAAEIANTQTFRTHVIEKGLAQAAQIANTQTFRTQVIFKFGYVLGVDEFEERSILNDVVGTLAANGQPGETFTYSLSDDAGGRFALSGAIVIINTAIDAEMNYDQATSRNITAVATGDMGTVLTDTFTIHVRRAVGWDPRFRMSTFVMDPTGFTNNRVAQAQNALSTAGPVYGDVAMVAGKYYWEVQLAAAAQTSTIYAGLSAFGLSNMSGSDTANLGFMWNQSGTYFFNGSSTSSHGTFDQRTDRLMFAYDGATGKVWCGKNGTWNQSGDPAAGTNPAATLAVEQRRRMLACVNMGVTASAQNPTFTFCGESGQQTYSAPSGFSPLAYTAAPAVKFDGQVHADFGILNSGRTAQKNTSTTLRVAAVNAGGFGKFVFAFKLNKISTTSYVGMHPQTGATTSVSFTATLIRSSDGQTSKSGATAGNPAYGALVTGDIVMMAIDAATGKHWFGKNGTWFSSGDPAAGTGQAFTDTGAGVIARLPFVGLQTVGDSADFLAGNNYPYDVPVGFRSLESDPPIVPADPGASPPTTEPVPDPVPAVIEDPVADPVAEPSVAIIANVQEAYALTDASTSLLADTQFQSNGVVSPGSSGSVRAANPVYGRKYWETFGYCDTNRNMAVGVGTLTASLNSSPGEDANGIGYRSWTGKLRASAADLATYATWNTSKASFDRIGVAYDSVTRQIWFSKNGVWQSGTPGSVSGGTSTMTIASPCVVTKTAHGLTSGAQVYFTTTGALPTGVVANQIYFADVINANTYRLRETPSGSSVNTSGSQSGTHTAFTGVGSTPSATLAAGTYYPIAYIDNSGGSNYVKFYSSFSAFHGWGKFRLMKYTPPAGFTPFAAS